MAKYQSFYTLIRLLRKEFNLSTPVYVRRCKPDTCNYAETMWNPKGRHFLIRIDPSINEDFSMHLLLHEFAHVLCWDVPIAEDHSDVWGTLYARVFRVYESWVTSTWE